MAVNVILLAGAANTGPLKDVSPATNEALIDIGGKPMVQYVIDGLRQSKEVKRIVIVAPPGELEPHVTGENLEFVPSGGHIIENILNAYRVLPKDEQLLIATSDIPLITGEIIDGLIALCREKPADLYYPIVEKSVGEKKYPYVKRTYVNLKEGVFTGGNLFLVNPALVESTAPKARAFLDYRKKPMKMVTLLGFSFLLRYLLFHNLTLAELEQKVSTMWGLRGAVIICPWPEVGIDVDKPSDLQLARAVLL
ncbi:MAG TPA: NTP transferase domain-containing protein [Symbiobacteriaceae bacterium]|nr:NTP transferase domain-containing protein [Symbiobacteriaceae bacterium]